MNGSLERSPTPTLSRPKIHRLPVNKPLPVPRVSIAFPRPVFLPFTVAVTALFAVFAIQKQVTHLSGATHAAPFLPPVIVDANASVLPAEKSPETLIFAGASGTIVGRFAHVPSDVSQITEVHPITSIDKEAARELLSIISRIN